MMVREDSTPEQTASDLRRARGFRIAGGITLVVGLGLASLVWWIDSRSASAFDADSKIEVRQVETLYGQQGIMLQNLTDALKQPGTQAVLILVVTGLIAAGCFYVAYLSARDVE